MKTEVRIGNLVDFNGKVETVYAIRNSGVDFYRGKTKKSVIMQSYVWEAIKPIPLTEEWLLKFGLDKLDGCFSLQTKRGNLIIEEDLCEITGNYNDIGFNAPCKYVHQLQNLYFTLTNEELKIK